MWTACCTPSPPPDTSSSSSYTFHPSITSLLYLTHSQPGLLAFQQTPICSNLHVQHHFHLEQLLVFLCKSSMPLSEIIVCVILHGNTTPVLRTVVVGSLGCFPLRAGILSATRRVLLRHVKPRLENSSVHCENSHHDS